MDGHAGVVVHPCPNRNRRGGPGGSRPPGRGYSITRPRTQRPPRAGGCTPL